MVNPGRRVRNVEILNMLLEKADVQGYLTTDDLIEVYPDVSRDAEHLEAVMLMLRRRGVDILDHEQAPYYFDEKDVLALFRVCSNIKHLAMLQTLFYGCLRSSEMCKLDDGDLDLKTKTLRLREREHECGRDQKLVLVCRHRRWRDDTHRYNPGREEPE